MTKRFLASLLAVLMVVSMIPLTAFAAPEDDTPLAVPTAPALKATLSGGEWSTNNTVYTITLGTNDSAAKTVLDKTKAGAVEGTTITSKTYKAVEGNLQEVASDAKPSWEYTLATPGTESSDGTPATLALTFGEAPTAPATYFIEVTTTTTTGTEPDTTTETTKEYIQVDVPDSRTEVTAVELEMTAPTIGATLPTAVTVKKANNVTAEAEVAKLATAAVTWKKGNEAASNEAIQAPGTYTATITVSPVTGTSKLAANATYKLNGTDISATFNAETGTASITNDYALKTALAKTDFTVTGADGELVYNGQDKTVSIGVAAGDKKGITPNDYTATLNKVTGEGDNKSYSPMGANEKPKNAGTYVYRIVAKGDNFTTTEPVTMDEFTIAPATLTVNTKAAAGLTKVYDGGTTAPDGWESKITVTLSGAVTGDTLTQGTHYTLIDGAFSAANATEANAAAFTCKVKLADNVTNYTFADDAREAEIAEGLTGTITKKPIADIKGGWTGTDLTYTGEELAKPKYNFTADQALLEAKEYKVYPAKADGTADKTQEAIETLTAAGDYVIEATVAVNAENSGNYNLTATPTTVSQKFTVKPITVTGVSIESGNAATVTTGTELTAKVNPTSAASALSYQWFNGDGEIEGATSATYSVKATDTGEIHVEIALTDTTNKNIVVPDSAKSSNEIELNKKPLTAAMFKDFENVVYDGTAHEPAVVLNEGQTIDPKNYKATYSNNTNVGTATVTITAKAGEYTGTVVKTFQITAKAPAMDVTEAFELAIGESKVITVETDGNITATGGDHATATVNNIAKTVTVTGTTKGATTVTINAAAGTNYSANASMTVEATVKGKVPTISSTTAAIKVGNSTTISVTTDGTITKTDPANTSVATVTKNENENVITINGIAEGTTTFTVTAPATETYETKTFTVTVSVLSGSSSGGSTGGGDEPGPSTPPTTPPTPTPEPPKATVAPTVDGDTASGKVDGDTISDLITEAGNKDAGEVVVEVKPSSAPGVDTVKAELPAESMKDLADAKVDLTVSTPVADVTLPQETLKELGAGTGAVTVTAAQTDTSTTEAPGTKIEVTVEQGGKAVEAGVTATVPANVVSNMAGYDKATVTVSTPVADVVLPNSTLVAAGKNDVSVSAAPTANGTAIEVKKNGVTMTDTTVQVSVPVPETSDDNTVAYIVDASGNKTIMPKSAAADGEMNVLLNTGKATITYGNNAKTFSDSASVPGWAKSSFTTSRELIKGIDNGNGGLAFRPNKTTTRAELVTMLHRLENEPNVGNVNFDDMKGNEWYKDAAAWAQTKNVVNGTDKGFEGNKTITRQELATMLYRYMNNVTGYKGKTGDYSSIAGGDKVNSWAAEAMRWAYGSGIIDGKADSAGNRNLDPTGLATRAEVSAMLERFVKLIAG